MTSVHRASFHDEFIPLDTRRNDGLNHTSLSVLGVKKSHKTQTQKTFQQFNKKQQELHNRTSKLSFNSSHNSQTHHVIAPQSPQFYQDFAPPNSQYRGATNGNASSLSLNLPPQQQQHQYHQQPPSHVLPQGHWSSTPELIKPNERYSNTSSSIDNAYEKFSNFTNSPTLSQSEWNVAMERLQFLEAENESLVGELEKFQEFKDLNEVLIEENEMLRNDLRQQIREHEQRESEEASAMEKDSVSLRREIALKTEELEQSQRESEKLELQIESMAQEIAKLKILHKTAQDKKDREINVLKEECLDLQNELDTQSQNMNNNSPMTSASTTPKSFHHEDFEENSKSKAISSPINTPKLTSTPKLSSTPKLPCASQQSHTEELVNDLLITIRQLKSDNSLLSSEKSLLYDNVSKQKKFIKRLVESKNQRVKIRRGFNIVEGVDVLI